MSLTIKVTLYLEGDIEEDVIFPAKMEVCSECEGTGYTLCDGMKGHVYSAEEFNDTFDDEDRAHYFTRGGKYDQVCQECKGKNVVPVIDEQSLSSEQKAQFARQWVSAHLLPDRWEG
jgi:RecJ-like exonuclease